MDATSRDAFTLEVKLAIFAELSLSVASLDDLGGFESFIFLDRNTNLILRITHESHRSAEQILAELAFISHLDKAACSVCRPVMLPNSETLISLHGFHICQFERAIGRDVQDIDRTPMTHQNWGRAIGGFHHAVGQNFSPVKRRPQWHEDENLDFLTRIPQSQHLVLQRAEENLARLRSFPKSVDTYGLIHSDPHSGNFFIAPGGKLSFFDFDDSVYQWFAFDIATILFGVVLNDTVPADAKSESDAAKRFLDDFFIGYREKMPVTDFLLKEMPTFIRCRELSLYAVIHAHGLMQDDMTPDDIVDAFPRRFMQGRRKSLEADAPFIELDYLRLFS